jgi:DNA-binding SARP family transcriptional activator
MPEMTGDSRLRFGVPGAFRVGRDGQEVDPGPRLQRTLLAILVVDAGHVVAVDRLIDLLWREGPPAAAIASVQAYISQLRRVVEPGRPPRAPARVLVIQDPRYLLRVTDDQVDALQFQALARTADNDLAGGQPAAAAAAGSRCPRPGPLTRVGAPRHAARTRGRRPARPRNQRRRARSCGSTLTKPDHPSASASN